MQTRYEIYRMNDIYEEKYKAQKIRRSVSASSIPEEKKSTSPTPRVYPCEKYLENHLRECCASGDVGGVIALFRYAKTKGYTLDLEDCLVGGVGLQGEWDVLYNKPHQKKTALRLAISDYARMGAPVPSNRVLIIRKLLKYGADTTYLTDSECVILSKISKN